MLNIQPYLFLLCLVFIVLKGQAQDKTKLYPFNAQYFNLESLEIEPMATLYAQSFKTESAYANKFQALAIDKIAYKGKLFEFIPKNGILLKDLSTYAARPLDNPDIALKGQGQHYFMSVEGGIICLKHLDDQQGYKLYKYNEEGKALFTCQIPYSTFVQQHNLEYHLPYLRYLSHSPKHIVFSSYVQRIPKTIVVSSSDGKISEYNFSAQSVILDAERNEELLGFVQINVAKQLLQIAYLEENFDLQTTLATGCDAAESLLWKNKLYLLLYNRSSEKTNLLCLDLKSKTILWTQEQLGLQKKTSYNSLWLSKYKDNLIVEGFQENGKFLELFQLKDGQRVWSSIK